MKLKAQHALQWIAEPLEEHPSFAQKRMFGCQALYLHGRMMLVLAANEEPWNGLLICTFREHHAALVAQFPALTPHAVLGKWLYLSQAHDDFERLVGEITGLVRRDDPRLGIVPNPKKRKRKTKARTASVALAATLFCLGLARPSQAADMRDVAPCDAYPKVHALRAQELQSLYQADQKDRVDFETHPEKPMTPARVVAMGRRDLKRRTRVAEIFAEGCLKAAEDFAAAAMIFQHGTSPDHFYEAFVWSKRGVELGDTKQKKLMAMALDRYLVNIGHKQLFATQARKADVTGPCWCLQAIEPEFPDSLRAEYETRSRDAAVDWLKGTLNAGNDCPDVECKDELKPTPRSFIPGFW